MPRSFNPIKQSPCSLLENETETIRILILYTGIELEYILGPKK